MGFEGLSYGKTIFVITFQNFVSSREVYRSTFLSQEHTWTVTEPKPTVNKTFEYISVPVRKIIINDLLSGLRLCLYFIELNLMVVTQN